MAVENEDFKLTIQGKGEPPPDVQKDECCVAVWMGMAYPSEVRLYYVFPDTKEHLLLAAPSLEDMAHSLVAVAKDLRGFSESVKERAKAR